MIDKRQKRDELQEAVRKATQTITDCRDHINYLNGAITLLNELIADEESENAQPTA